MSYYQKAFGIAELRKDSFQMADILANIGVLYYQMEEYSKSIDYYQQDLGIRRVLQDQRNIGRAYSNMSSSYGAMKEHQNAAKFARMALNISEERGDKYDQIYDLHNLGQAYIDLKKYDLAYGYMTATIQLSEEINDYSVKSLGHKGLADISMARNEFKDAKENYNKALDAAIQSGNIYDEIKIRKSIVKADSIMGDYQNAFVNLSVLKARQDSIFAIEKIKTLEELQAKYDVAKKDDEIAILKIDNELKASREERSMVVRNSLIIGSILLLVLLIVIYNRYRLKQKSLKTIEAKNMENQLLVKEIHHRVKNNLQIVLSLLNAQTSLLTNDDKALSIIMESQNRIKSLALIHQDLYQSQNIVSVNAKNYFQKLLKNVEKSFTNPNKQIDLQTHIENIDINMSLSVSLGLILNELVTNSYKYAFQNKRNGAMIITFNKIADENSYHLKVTDDGQGLPSNMSLDTPDSFGLQLVKGLTSQLNGSIKTTSDQGTEFDIIVRDIGETG